MEPIIFFIPCSTKWLFLAFLTKLTLSKYCTSWVENIVEDDTAEHAIENPVEFTMDAETEFISSSNDMLEYAIKDAVEHTSDEETERISSNTQLLLH